jgi:aarF domain-containing kinase
MSKLHSNGKPHSFHHTKRVIQKAFGMDFDDIFEEFGHEPIGCGAIAQVRYKDVHRLTSGVQSDS